MYFHLDDQSYKLAKAGVALSDKPVGEFNNNNYLGCLKSYLNGPC